MMKHIMLWIVGILSAVAVNAQAIQTMPSDPSVASGFLPNGLAYYIACDPTYKGLVDFALVQKTGKTTVLETGRKAVVAAAQDAMASQYRLAAPSVQDYFIRAGALPGRNGFVQVTDKATVFRFENIILNGSEHVVDSSLLVLLGMVEKSVHRDDAQIRDWYSTSDQAIVVSGDVDAGKVLEKLKMLSYMIPSSDALPREEYVWKEQDSLSVCLYGKPGGETVTVSAMWRLQRTPKEAVGTVQPLIYERLMTELGIIAKERICNVLKKSGVPYADVTYDYVSSLRSSDDESFRIEVSVEPQHMEHAVSAMAATMASIDSHGAGLSEIRRAGQAYMDGIKAGLKMGKNRVSGLDRCVSAFVHGSYIVSPSDVVKFHASRDISDEIHLKAFNSVASASLDNTRNLVIGYSGGCENVSPESFREIFAAAWNSGQSVRPAEEDNSVPSMKGQSLPVKLKSSRKEHMTDGKIWTLSNGFRIVFKRMPAENEVCYALALNGGFANVRSLKPGEGAYMSEILRLSTIGGVRAERFFDLMRDRGITVDLNVGLSTMTMKGRAPEDGLENLISMLLTIMNDRNTDRSELEYYIGCESVRKKHIMGNLEARVNAIDSIMCPGYVHSLRRNPASLTEMYANKADVYMNIQAGKMNDGMLVLVGDIDERVLKTLLLQYAGGFRTENRMFSRPVVRYQPLSGTMMCNVDGESDSIDIVMSSPMALTADNYYAAALASMALRRNLARVAAESGMWLRLNHDCRKYPQERFNVLITAGYSPLEGFVAGTEHKKPVSVLNMLNVILDNPESLEISESELKSWKNTLKKYISDQKNDPEYWLRALTMRYLDGKDFTTAYEEKIDAVTVDKIKYMLSSLASGSKVEYVTNKR